MKRSFVTEGSPQRNDVDHGKQLDREVESPRQAARVGQDVFSGF
jgi:hypothetical protein